MDIVACSIGGQTQAARIQIQQPNPAQFWQVQWMQAAPAALPKGSVLRLKFWARSETRNPVVAVYEHAADPYEKLLSELIVLSPEWEEYALVFTLPQDVPAQWAGVRFQMGHKAGTVEMTGISLENWGIAPNPMPKASKRDPYGGQKSDPDWWKAADARIEQIRKGNLQVQVMDAQGKPVPNATVEVKQRRHKFRFGTAIAPHALFDTGPDGKKYRDTILRLFNCVVLEDQLKWAAEDWHEPGTAERMLKWCEAHKLPVRGHCLLWPNYEHLPKSKRNLRGAELRKAIQDHITEYVTRVKGRVYVWDVINEAVSNRQIIDELGGEDILVEAFQRARAADPKVRLAYNDFNILNDRAGSNEAHRRAAMGVIKRLLEANAPLNSLGIQGHISLPLTPGDKLVSILDSWAQFGLPIEITEYDLVSHDDALHAAYMKEFLTAVFSHPAVDSFLMWGFWEGAHWLAAQGGAMFRKDWTPRPTVGVYEDLVFKQWWTNASAQTDSKGEATLRVFLGEHELVAKKGNLDSRAIIQVEEGGNSVKRLVIRLQ
jgi:GH35 family endo-1,4-beta-xylanase